MYYIGEGVAEDKREAAKWWRLAADNGHTYAQFYLGWMYDQGIEFAEDDCEAARWYGKARVAGGRHEEGRVEAVASRLNMWYEYKYSEEEVTIPDCDALDFLNYQY